MAKNILIMGVGGQGLVLATQITANAAMLAGLKVKTNDVVGMSQRGGMVWGSIRYGEVVHSTNVPIGQGDVLLGMEPLEALRGSRLLKKGSTIILNTEEVFPSPVILEKAKYPYEEIEALKEDFKVIEVNATEVAKESGNIKTANTVQLGILAAVLDDIEKETFLQAVINFVPEKAVEANKKAFEMGYKIGKGENKE